MSRPKTLILDIETSPMQANIWSLWSEAKSYDMVDMDWYVLCWSAIWDGERAGQSASLPMFDLYQSEPENDREVVRAIWELLNDADIVVAHSLDRFDLPKLMSRFVFHKLGPPSPFRKIDTLKLARRYFKFSSNRLDDLGKHLGLGRKKGHEGFGLWRKVMDGDPDAWKRMVKYCERDTVLLHDVYHRLLPYCSGTPNMANYSSHDGPVCSKCGSTNLKRNGHAYTAVGKYQRYQCRRCGAYSRGRIHQGQRPVTTGIL